MLTPGNGQLDGGVPFISDADLQAALDKAGERGDRHRGPGGQPEARLDGLRAALVVLAVVALLALFSARRIPTAQPGSAPLPFGLAFVGLLMGVRLV